MRLVVVCLFLKTAAILTSKWHRNMCNVQTHESTLFLQSITAILQEPPVKLSLFLAPIAKARRSSPELFFPGVTSI
ncbi:uncharacterized protein B0J16DRAFT_339262, partial [Fusarium flagelliforme]|uniref:uncharacterized protein n=1 Tax=Fusarium flagelliforme TaxID=2675880 RepID=UPI001E8CC3C4